MDTEKLIGTPKTRVIRVKMHERRNKAIQHRQADSLDDDHGGRVVTKDEFIDTSGVRFRCGMIQLHKTKNFPGGHN